MGFFKINHNDFHLQSVQDSLIKNKQCMAVLQNEGGK